MIAAVVGILVLLVLAIPVTQINLGAQDNGQMPESTTIRQSYDALTKGFGVGYNGPLLVAVDMKPPAQQRPEVAQPAQGPAATAAAAGAAADRAAHRAATEQ